MNYSGVCYGPKPRPWIAPDTSWAPTAPYYGEKLAYLTSMTPFNKENFVPVLQESGVPDYLSFELGGWLLDTLDSVVGSTGIKTGATGRVRTEQFSSSEIAAGLDPSGLRQPSCTPGR